MHTDVRTHVHTHTHTYRYTPDGRVHKIDTSTPTYVHPYTRVCMCADTQHLSRITCETYMHAYIQTYTHTET